MPAPATPSLPPPPAGNYIDHKCPFTGNVSIRGRILAGKVKSTKMNRTIVVRRDYLHFIKKYQRCARGREPFRFYFDRTRKKPGSI